jgi:hypothetical protein
VRKSWKDTLNQEERKKLQHLENQIAILKHERYKLQNAASKRISDAVKAKIRKQDAAKRKPKAKKKSTPAAVAADSPTS